VGASQRIGDLDGPGRNDPREPHGPRGGLSLYTPTAGELELVERRISLVATRSPAGRASIGNPHVREAPLPGLRQ